MKVLKYILSGMFLGIHASVEYVHKGFEIHNVTHTLSLTSKICLSLLA